jgi:hypothetical protein
MKELQITASCGGKYRALDFKIIAQKVFLK